MTSSSSSSSSNIDSGQSSPLSSSPKTQIPASGSPLRPVVRPCNVQSTNLEQVLARQSDKLDMVNGQCRPLVSGHSSPLSSSPKRQIPASGFPPSRLVARSYDDQSTNSEQVTDGQSSPLTMVSGHSVLYPAV